jgi:glucokinase
LASAPESGGVISHGVLLRGAQGSGGELGHVIIQATGPRCACGNHGCLEALASGAAIGRRAREVAVEKPDSALGRLAVERKILGEDVTELAQKGDEAALCVLEEAGRWLGIGLAGFVNIFNPARSTRRWPSRAGTWCWFRRATT